MLQFVDMFAAPTFKITVGVIWPELTGVWTTT